MSDSHATLKTCKKCNIPKPENEFYVAAWDKTKRRATCISCHKRYHNDNLDIIKVQRKEFRANNKELLATRGRTDKRRAQQRSYNKKRTILGKISVYEKAKRKADPIYRIRKCVSKTIARALANIGGKKTMSFLKKVPYTMAELKEHLEKQFEPWMTWDNHGPYKISEWNDNDPTTWRWSIDHIIPQSTLPYSSMDDDNFKKCWALENLRPLSAKQNLIDGTNRVRHV